MIFLFFITSLFAISDTTSLEEKFLGVSYFKPLFGHVHVQAQKTSPSLTTIQCAHPVKLLESSKVSVSENWAYVSVGEHKGFIIKDYLSDKRPDCLQGKYPKFFDSLQLDLSELHFWGRLYDHYVYGESRVR